MRFAVIGNPIAHSKSPQIHQAFAEQFGITLTYNKLLFEEANFRSMLTTVFTTYNGCNITVPFKELAYQYADSLSTQAKAAGAVNTLFKTDNGIAGYNTDGIGLINDLTKNHGVDLTNKKVLIAGAGGATKGVVMPLIEQGVKSITIVNRTVEKAIAVVESFADVGNLSTCGYSDLATQGKFDLIINATSASLAKKRLALPTSVFSQDGLAYDMFYANKPTLFMTLAKDNGMATVDGLGMLVEQAAAAFNIWYQVQPQTAPVIAEIRKQLENK